MGKKLLFYLVLGFFMTVSIGKASSPDEWMKFYKEVNTKCTEASGLIEAKQVGKLGESFSINNGASEVVLIRGLHNETYRKNAAGNSLCLFDKVKRTYECSEVDQWFNKGKK
jgi:hypothetical protein